MPAYLQTTVSECGLACLGYIADHHGHSLSMGELRSRFPVSIRGTTFSDLVRFSKLIGFSARPVRLELGGLQRLTAPCILHWDMNHFVVLIKCGAKKITIHDPARGVRTIPIEEVDTHFTGVALELTPSPGFEFSPPKPPISWQQLIGRVVGAKRSLSQLFILAASLQIVFMISPLFTQWIVDGAIVSGDEDLLWVLALGFVLVTIIRVALESVRGWLSIVTSTQFGTQLAARVMGHLIHLPVQWFETRHTGDMASRFQSVQSIQQTITGKLVDILLDGIFALVTLVVMFFYSPKLVLVVIVSISIYAAIRVIPHAAFHRASDEALTHDAKAQSHFLETLRAIQPIKLSGLEDQRVSRWLNLAVQATNRKAVTQKMTLAFDAGYSLAFGFETIAILWWGAALTIGGVLSVGMLMAFVSYKNEFSSRMQRFIDNTMSIRMLSLHTERLADIVLSEKEKFNDELPQVDVADYFDSSIKIDDVSFRYGAGGPWILKNISLDIKAGEHVAIVGETGCGKTTLAKLILGLLEPTQGVIRVGGVPIQQIGLSNWRRNVGAVMQDDQLLSASVQDNISSFDDHVDIERVREAAKLAAVHDEIVAMPMGYHSLNGDMGSSLSGGQKQRILLARALYRRSRILVLDEATSHLDVLKERQVNESIRDLAVTRITIAHRPETIAMADRVVNLSA